MSINNIKELKTELMDLQKKHREEARVKAVECRKKEQLLKNKIDVLQAEIIKEYGEKTNEFLAGKISKEELESFARKNNLINIEDEKEESVNA